MARDKRANGAGTVYVKHGSYYGRWSTAGGGRANRKLGPIRRPGSSSGLTRTQAEKRLRELMGAVEVARDPERTVGALGQMLLVQLAARSRTRSHMETVESHLRVHLIPFFGDKAIDRIDEEQVARLLAALRRRGLAAKTIRNIASTLHSVFTIAVRKKWLRENPCRLVDLPGINPTADVRFLSQEELARVIAVGIRAGPRQSLYRALYLIAAMTGLRQGELLALRWRDIDLDASKLRVRQAYVRGEFKEPKSVRGSRGVPLARQARTALLEHRVTSSFVAEDDLVFANPATGGPLERGAVRRRLQRACRRADVRVVRFHDLRHTFGTRMAASGEVSLRTLQQWMGHRDLKTTLIYADYQPGEHEAEIVRRAFDG